MAGVPSSGTLEMVKLARERRWADYGGNGIILGPIPMYNLIFGGNSGGGTPSGETYLSPNASSPTVLPNTTPFRFSDFYGYKQVTTRTAFDFIYNATSSVSACSSGLPSGTTYYHTGLNLDPSIGDVVYQGAYPSTTVAGNGYYAVYSPTFPNNATGNWFRITDSNGTVMDVQSC